jgi:transposase
LHHLHRHLFQYGTHYDGDAEYQWTQETINQHSDERDQFVAERTLLKNQLHADQTEAHSNERSISTLTDRINLITRQEQEIKSEIAGIIKQDTNLLKRLELLTSIPGIGKLTAVIILAGTNGFELIRNKKQLVSYAGLDVKEKNARHFC